MCRAFISRTRNRRALGRTRRLWQISCVSVALTAVPCTIRVVAPHTAVELANAAYCRRKGSRCLSKTASRATVVFGLFTASGSTFDVSDVSVTKTTILGISELRTVDERTLTFSIKRRQRRIESRRVERFVTDSSAGRYRATASRRSSWRTPGLGACASSPWKKCAQASPTSSASSADWPIGCTPGAYTSGSWASRTRGGCRSSTQSFRWSFSAEIPGCAGEPW